MTNYGPGPGGTPPEGTTPGGQSNATPGGQPTMPTEGYSPPPGPQPGAPGPQPAQYGPPAGYVPPPAGAPPAAAPPRGRSPLLIIGGIVLALVLLCVVAGVLLVGGVLNATQPVADAGDAYMAALRDGDYSKAFDLSTSAVQQEVGDAEGLQAGLGGRQLASWIFTSRNISNGQGSLSGTATYTNGESGTVEMVLNQVGNDWKVAGLTLR